MELLLFLGSSLLSALLVGAARANLNAEAAPDGTMVDSSPPTVVVSLPSTGVPPPPAMPWDQNKRQAELPPALPSGRLDPRGFVDEVLQPSPVEELPQKLLLRDLPAVRKSPPGTPHAGAVQSPPPPRFPPRPSTTRILSPPPPRGDTLPVEAGANE